MIKKKVYKRIIVCLILSLHIYYFIRKLGVCVCVWSLTMCGQSEEYMILFCFIFFLFYTFIFGHELKWNDGQTKRIRNSAEFARENCHSCFIFCFYSLSSQKDVTTIEPTFNPILGKMGLTTHLILLHCLIVLFEISSFHYFLVLRKEKEK